MGKDDAVKHDDTSPKGAKEESSRSPADGDMPVSNEVQE